MPAPAAAATGSIQRAHRTLSFQLSGAQLGISITTLVTGYLAEPLVADLPHPCVRRDVDVARHGRRGHGVGAGAADRDVGVDGVRRAGPEVPRGGHAAADRPRRRAGPQLLFSLLFTPADPA